jgi:hypothetical protein
MGRDSEWSHCKTCENNPDNEPDGDPQEERRIEQHSFGVDCL